MKAFYVRWLGQGGFEISDGSSVLFLDPYLSDLVEKIEGLKRLVPPPILPQAARPDLCLITHDHIDHLDSDAISAMDTRPVRFAAPGSCAAKLAELGVPAENIHRLDRGGRMAFGGFAIEAVYAKHTEDSIGLVLSSGGIRAYFTGDSELDDEVGRGLGCDALFVCINGRWGNMGIADALALASRVDAKLAIPNHYGMFAENDADPEPFLAGLRAAGRRGYRMAHGERFDLGELLAGG
jgi:L-ascorbate 6-phosphate lactonase